MAKRFYRKDRGAEKDTKYNFRINDMIRIPQVRIVGDNIDDISKVAGKTIEASEICNTRDALHWATELNLDLVEISPNANPPVCKIMDYSKFIYDKKKREKEMKANAAKTVVKEVRFTPNTDDHDFDFKLRHAQEFLKEGAKVKAYVHFKGRAIVFKDRGELLLLNFIKALEDFGAPEHLPQLEGRRMYTIIAPLKKSAKKITS